MYILFKCKNGYPVKSSIFKICKHYSSYASVRLGEADRAMPVLIEDLGNEERGARLQAAHALDALGEKARPATEALKRALDDEFDYVKRTARHALWVLGERSCPYQNCEAE